MKVFISGGCKNGKSSHGERICKELSLTKPPLYYIATMMPSDCEDESRIKRHKESRKHLCFTTIEHPRDINDIKEKEGSFILDSLTALLANEMFLPDGTVVENAVDKIIEDLKEFFLREINLVMISDYIYSDTRKFDKLSEHYRKSLAKLDRFCAMESDIVLEAVCGNIITHKGDLSVIYK